MLPYHCCATPATPAPAEAPSAMAPSPGPVITLWLMNGATPLVDDPELAAALLQAAITAALAGVCGFLFQRYRKPYLAWWSVAWTLYLLRLAAIISFVSTQQRAWLYWHQVTTGWTALALLAAALVFS